MKISKDKKKQILSDKDSLSITEISKKYNIPRSEVKNIFSDAEKKTPIWFYAVLVLIPFILLILLELSLRFFNYGFNTTQWVDAGNGKYIINPELGKKYFTNVNFIPATTEDVFDQQKKSNAFRIFVLGGSSAAGYPFIPVGSFSHYIKRRLELVYPNTPIEVVNIGMTGVNTYTLLDLIPGVLDKQPDLILIYAGHNEYYGALGVGSMESLGSSRSLINLILYLDKFKTTQLVRNTLRWFSSLFSSGSKEKPSGTLMSRMAKDQTISLNSEKFNAGIEQFMENMEDILSRIRERGVPVILGNLVSNLKDQKPFISINTPGYKTANQVYEEAQLELKNKNIGKADSLFRLAKDLDGLRFRAPEKMNEAIDSLSSKYHIVSIQIDKIFDSASPDGISGSSLLVDHLHPNIKGYQLMGKSFYEAMEKSGVLPKTENPEIPFEKQDSTTLAKYIFTELDTSIGSYTVTLLKNDWPFVNKKRTPTISEIFQPQTYTDSIALEYIEKKMPWPDAHLNVATYYLRKDNIKKYLEYMDELIYQYPNLVDFSSALKYFYENNKINPADYTTKRIGIIALYQGNYDNAVNYLTEVYKSDPNDPRLLYYLSEAYFHKGDIKAALNSIDKCLKINPYFQDAINLKNQIIKLERVK